MKIKVNILMLLLFLMTRSNFVHSRVETTKPTMFNQTLAQIRILSSQLPDPIRADRAMHQLLCANIKLTRKVPTKNLIRSIMKKNIGTNDVVKYVGCEEYYVWD